MPVAKPALNVAAWVATVPSLSIERILIVSIDVIPTDETPISTAKTLTTILAVSIPSPPLKVSMFESVFSAAVALTDALNVSSAAVAIIVSVPEVRANGVALVSVNAAVTASALSVVMSTVAAPAAATAAIISAPVDVVGRDKP